MTSSTIKLLALGAAAFVLASGDSNKEDKKQGNPIPFQTGPQEWSSNDLLVGIKNNALSIRKQFKDNEEFIFWAVASAFGPEAATALELGDSIVDGLVEWFGLE